MCLRATLKQFLGSRNVVCMPAGCGGPHWTNPRPSAQGRPPAPQADTLQVRRASAGGVLAGCACLARRHHRRGEGRGPQAHLLCDLWPRRTAVWRRAGQVSCCSWGVDGVVELVEGRTKPALDCLRGSPWSGKGGDGGPAQAREGSGTSGGNSETTPGRGIGLGQGLHQIVPVGLQPVLGQFPLHRNVTPIGLCADIVS